MLKNDNELKMFKVYAVYLRVRLFWIYIMSIFLRHFPISSYVC